MTHPWWWYLPGVGYWSDLRHYHQCYAAVTAYHDRDKPAPPDVFEACQTAHRATFPSFFITVGWLLGLFTASVLLGRWLR